ncbi:hypothetical protein BH09MYX1_BH09MYX1_49840 [soil metagenome]
MTQRIVNTRTSSLGRVRIFALLLAACGPAALNAPGGKTSSAEAAKKTDTFYADERAVLGLLGGADARIALRTGIEPSDDQSGKAVLGAILAEDANAAVESGHTDIFSFDVRARALAEARKNLQPYLHPIADPHPNDGKRPELERQLLVRLVDEEDARLAEERKLPQSAAVLVRAVATTWVPPKSMADLEKRDAWFATRIEGLRTSLVPKTLRSDDIADLEDALDPLERVAFSDGTPYTKSHVAFTELRIALGSLAAGPGIDPATQRTAFIEALRAHLGVSLSPETLARIFENAADAIEKEITALGATPLTAERLENESSALLAPRRCTFRATSLLRRSPPPERAYACILAPRVEKEGSADDILGVLSSAHTALTVGSWALWMLAGNESVKPAGAHAKPLLSLPPEIAGRLERRARTAPVSAVGDALVAEWMYRNGMKGSALRAQGWMIFGDSPFDVLERDLRPQTIVPQKPPVLKVTDGPAPSGTFTAVPPQK